MMINTLHFGSLMPFTQLSPPQARAAFTAVWSTTLCTALAPAPVFVLWQPQKNESKLSGEIHPDKHRTGHLLLRRVSACLPTNVSATAPLHCSARKPPHMVKWPQVFRLTCVQRLPPRRSTSAETAVASRALQAEPSP